MSKADKKEQEELRHKYAGIELSQVAPRSEWVTVDEMREILYKDNDEFYKKLKYNG